VGWLVVLDANAAPGCYPANEFVYGGMTGPTHADGHVSGRFKRAEAEVEYNQETEYPLPSGRISVDFDLDITGNNTGPGDGGLMGHLVVSIRWDDPRLGITTFRSSCAAEVQTEYLDGMTDGGMEAELEGTVTNFPAPGWGGTRPAVASIMVIPGTDSEDPPYRGPYVVKFTLELGTTCFENVFDGGGYEIEFGGIILDRVRGSYINIDNQDSGRWGFPGGFNESNCPGAD
jgi:hypothetical protein